MNILTLSTKVLILTIIAGSDTRLNGYLTLNKHYLRRALFPAATV